MSCDLCRVFRRVLIRFSCLERPRRQLFFDIERVFLNYASWNAYHSFVVPYSIRVDEFTTPKTNTFTVPALHSFLLSHTHSDHIIGLNAKSFGSLIICSIDSKAMLLRHETFRSRDLKEKEYQQGPTRTFSHLKGDYLAPSSSADGIRSGSVDLLVSFHVFDFGFPFIGRLSPRERYGCMYRHRSRYPQTRLLQSLYWMPITVQVL